MNRLILLALALPAVALPAVALGAEPRVIATFESIGVYWTPPADPGPGGCPIQFRKSGESAWREGLPLWFDARNAECRGSLVQLEPGTKYEIQLGGARFSASTWNERLPIAKTVKVTSGAQPLNITEGGTREGYVLYAGEATIDGGEILIGTRMLRDYRLRIDFPARTVAIDKN